MDVGNGIEKESKKFIEVYRHFHFHNTIRTDHETMYKEKDFEIKYVTVSRFKRQRICPFFVYLKHWLSDFAQQKLPTRIRGMMEWNRSKWQLQTLCVFRIYVQE
jgi:hypothetical protein